MKAQGTSQEELAEALGCTRGAVGHYLNGRRVPSLEQFENIAKSLKVDLIWLMHGNNYAGVKEGSGEYKVKKGYLLPVNGDTKTGYKRKATAYLSIPTPADKCYALSVDSDDYAPRIYEGEVLLIDPNTEPDAGDEVVIHYKNKQVKLHTFINNRRERTTVDSIVGEKDRQTIKDTDIKSMERVIAIFRASELVE